MKNTCVLSVFVLLSVSSFAQSGSPQTKQVSTQANGVVVHESAGNEGFVQPVSAEVSPVHLRTIEEWSLPECIDGLTVIEQKIAMLSSSEEDTRMYSHYVEQKNRIEKRRQTLMINQQ